MSCITWKNASVDAPPRDRTVLVWYGGEPCLGSYRHSPSSDKNCTLPNADAWAVWLIDHREGCRQIYWWASIQDPDSQWTSP